MSLRLTDTIVKNGCISDSPDMPRFTPGTVAWHRHGLAAGNEHSGHGRHLQLSLHEEDQR